MASLTTQADAIRSAVTSTQTCTPTTSAKLKELLISREPEVVVETKTTSKSRANKTTQTTKGKTNTVAKRGIKAAAQNTQQDDGQDGGLSAKEKAVLATQVINATLKALGDAAKVPMAPKSPVKKELVKSATRNALRRSSSMPMTPLQPRSINRVSTSPAGAARPCRSSSISTASTGCLATVECARVAFATLRTLSSAGKVTLPQLQLESGMSSFVNKLLALNLFEHALKELRLLKRRLESTSTGSGNKTTKTTSSEPNSTSRIFAELFDYSSVRVSGSVLGIIIGAQLQALRILYGLKKSSHLDTALPFLRLDHKFSPLNLLLLSLKDEKPDRSKCTRQLDNLAQSLLSLTPSISAKDDGIAVEPRLSPSPLTAIEIQAFALTIRLHSWTISGHKGDVDKAVLFPLSRCLSAFTRRSSADAAKNFDVVNTAFNQVWQQIQNLKLKPSESSKSPLANIYQILGTVSRESGNVDEAKRWIEKLKGFINPKEDSPARYCSVAAQLLALSLKQSPQVDENLVMEVLYGLQGSLSGNTTELDDLLVSICQVRKAAMNIMLGGEKTKVKQTIREILDSLIFQLPRFVLRWLGKPPTSTSPKDFLRFEQRRQLLSKYINHILDSALMLTKLRLEDGKLEWEVIDSLLQDSLAVLENMGDNDSFNNKGNPAASYHVKVSHFYYQQHLILQKKVDASKQTMCLRALRRSIDSVKQRSEPEQIKSQLLMKQERLAELYRSSGRRDDAADTLRSVRDTLVREEIVPDITAALATQPPLQAWHSNDKTETLSRTVCNLAKLEHRPCDWTWLLSGLDKATALEHDLFFIYSNDKNARRQVDPSKSLVDKLLQYYSVDSYPLRRLRAMLQLLTSLMHTHDDAHTWMDEAKTLSRKLSENELGEDSGLARYVPHMQALTACVVGLFDAAPDSADIRNALTTWKVAITNCQSANDVYRLIDNPPQLLTNLQSLADFAKMKGLETLLVSILELSIEISELIANSGSEVLVVQNTALCLQHLTIGHSSKAEKVLQNSQAYMSRPGLSREAVAGFHLCSAEYHMTIGNFDKAERHLVDAQVSATAETDKPARVNKSMRKMSWAYASFLYSILALERGDSHHALYHAKNAVRTLFHDWAKLEDLRQSSGGHADEVSQTESSEDDFSFNGSRSGPSEIDRAKTGPEFWTMVQPLFRFVLRLSSIYAHIGMFQETMYYAEQAQKIAESMSSLTYISQSKAWLAAVAITAGKTEKALEVAEDVKSTLSTLEVTYSTINMICQLSCVFRDACDLDAESHLINAADSMLQELSGRRVYVAESDGVNSAQPKTGKIAIKQKPAPKAATRQTRGAKTTRVPSKTAAKKPTARRPESPIEISTPTPEEDLQLSFMRASILRHKSVSLLDKKEWAAAVAALKVACEISKLSTDITQERLFMAVAFIGQSLEQMGRDSVFSVIQDSTLSFPAVAGAMKDKDRMSLTRTTPPRKGRAPAQDVLGFLDNLRQAQDCLLEAHSIASLNGNGQLMYRIATLLQNAFILISTTSPSRSSGSGHPAHATCSIEMARNLVWRRERKTLRLDSEKAEKAEWPMPLQSADPRRCSLGFSIDMNRFQREYVDIIPKSWNVVSVSLSDNKHDLCITKLQTGHSPFAIRLPLERASSRDADSEVFDFQQGRSELLDIIQIANRTCHDARDMNAKGAKSAWWAEREALDERMKNLLENIEQTWLGGFRGIFSQHHRRSDLLARFQKSFQNILDKHLPSRRQVRGNRVKAAPATKISLDPRILDLFIGLGDATASSCDLDEPLTDLLYFVVDILQFHGERNAYDEIDFDAMVVDTFDALHSYHAAAKSSKDMGEGVHTILVLDKALHVFPWESLPCMQNLAVSRIPSLACLRRSIVEQRSHDVEEADEGSSLAGSREGHHISVGSGTYILNPGADLKNTSSTFGKPLSTLPPTWNSIETRSPSESEFESALTKSDLLLYFGHGSGAQYIRGRTIRKMEKCRAVALLMGCSSASLPDVGEFEPQGPVWNYMLAGSPAVVGTLWDVTDRDIDRFAGRVFEEWGLMSKGTFEDEPIRKGKGKAVKGKKKLAVEEAEYVTETSLVEAVAKSRDACRFRYLTAAAVCVYGIPVYISK